MAAGLDPRTPVLVGGGQVTERDGGVEPVELMASALRRAADDAGAPDVLAAIDSVRVVQILAWQYRDPGRLLAERVGASPRHTGVTGAGGSTPQVLVNSAAEDVAAGRADVVVVAGAESWRTRMRLGREERTPDWTHQDDAVPEAELLVPDVPMNFAGAKRIGLDRPVWVYPLFEQAIRAAAGRTHDEQRRVAGALWSRFSEVAAANPHAWTQQAYDADEIVAPSPGNRQVTGSYTKLMNSNNDVDQGAAVIVTSVATAERLGVPRERWVFPWAGTEAADAGDIGARHDLDRSPAIREAGRELFALVGREPRSVAHVDLYSCFPSAVQVAAAELGLPLDDPALPLTVTGGLSFAGGPWNDYSTHAIAALLPRLREDPGSLGLVTANSGYLTKHALGLYATDPPASPYRRVDVQDRVDAHPGRRSLEEYAGPAALESWTVVHDRDGAPEVGLAAVLTDDGARAFARTTDADDLRRLSAEQCEGTSVAVDADGTLRFSD